MSLNVGSKDRDQSKIKVKRLIKQREKPAEVYNISTGKDHAVFIRSLGKHKYTEYRQYILL